MVGHPRVQGTSWLHASKEISAMHTYGLYAETKGYITYTQMDIM